MNRRRWLGYAGAGIVAAAAGGTLAWRRLSPDAPSERAAAILFAQRLEALDGNVQALEQWRGRLLVVNFWATWCPPCVDEMPELDHLQGELGDRVRFIGIGVDSPANMRKFVEKIPVRYPLLVAGNTGAELARELGNTSGGLPYTVVIDEKGTVARQFVGRLDMATLRQSLQASGA